MSKAVVTLRADEPEACALVDATGGIEHAVRPERELLVPRSPGEGDALVDQSRADTDAASGRFHVEQSEPSDGFRMPDAEHRADDFTVALSDPAAFVLGIEVLDEVRGDLGDERLEELVPAVLLIVEHPLAVNDPADVALLKAP